MSKKKTDSMGNGRRRRLVRVGPGLVVALVLSVFVGVKWFGAETQMRQVRSGPPIVERQLVTSSFEEKSGPTPELKFVFERREKLGLSADQVGKLEKLRAEWEKVYRPKIEEANAAAEKAGGYLQDTHGNRSTPVAHIQKEAGPMIALSGEISAARRSYWSRAVSLLSSEQRSVLQREREADWAAKKAGMAGKR